MADAPEQFKIDRGASVPLPDSTLTGYALNFGIEGLTDCKILAGTISTVACTVYEGYDATQARSAYNNTKAALRTFVGAHVPINEETTTKGALTLTMAFYQSTEAKIMIERVEAQGSYAVLFYVSPIASY